MAVRSKTEQTDSRDRGGLHKDEYRTTIYEKEGIFTNIKSTETGATPEEAEEKASRDYHERYDDDD